MAKVTVGEEKVEVVERREVNTYTLEVSSDEARVILDILGRVTGRSGRYRNASMAVFGSLWDAMEQEGEALDDQVKITLTNNHTITVHN